MKVFGRKETIGDYALSKLDGLRQRLKDDENPDTLIDPAGVELGDSVEKVLFINQGAQQEGRQVGPALLTRTISVTAFAVHGLHLHAKVALPRSWTLRASGQMAWRGRVHFANPLVDST